MKLLIFFCALISLTACTDGMQKVDASIFIHDNSSKVWVVQKKMLHGKNYSPMRFEYREMIVFHENKNAYLHRIVDLGKVPGKKMIYWMDRDKNEFGFLEGKNEVVYHIKYLSRKQIVLSPKSTSAKFSLYLIPFPEY
jgi:hypothetical protein